VGVISVEVVGETTNDFEGVSTICVDPEVSGVAKFTEAQATGTRGKRISGIRNRLIIEKSS